MQCSHVHALTHARGTSHSVTAARMHPLSSQLVWGPGKVRQLWPSTPAINKIILYKWEQEQRPYERTHQHKSNPTASQTPPWQEERLSCPASLGPREQNKQASEVKVRGEPPVLSSKFAFSLVCGSGRGGGGVVLPAAVTSLVHPWREGPPAGAPAASGASAGAAAHAPTGGRGGGHLDDCSDAPLG